MNEDMRNCEVVKNEAEEFHNIYLLQITGGEVTCNE